MVSDENLAQIEALMMRLLEPINRKLDALEKKVPTATADRMRRYRQRNAKSDERNDFHSGERNGKKPKRNEKPVGEQHQKAIDVLEFLNHETHRKFPPVQTNLEIIEARLAEGYTEVQLRQIVVRKCREWGSDPKMTPYLRPKTIFNKTNAGNYAGELVVPSD